MNNVRDFLQPVQQEYLGIPFRVERSLVDDILKQDIYNQEITFDPNGTYRQIELIVVEPSTALTTGDNKATITVPFDGKLVAVHAFVTTASTSGAVDVTLADKNRNDLAYLVIAANKNGTEETGGQTAIDTGYITFLRYDQIKVNIDGIGTGSAGLVIQLYFIVDKFYYS